jgi:hypothetical protein
MGKSSAQPPPVSSVPSSNVSKNKIRKKRKKRDPNAPKRALTAFIFFSNEKRPQLKADFPNLSVIEIAKRLGTLWRETDDKTKWNDMAAQDKLRASQEKEAYLEQHST